MRSIRALLMTLAVVTMLSGLPARAADVTEVPAGVSTDAVKAFRAGLALHKDKKYALYKAALALRPTFPQAHDYIARAYLAKGDRPMALRHLEIVRRLDARLAHCLEEAIRRGDPDYNDMPWGS